MKKLLVVIVLSLLGSGCKEQIKPLQTWILDQTIYSVSFNEVDNILSVLTKDSVKLLSLLESKDAEEYFNIGKIINGEILFEEDSIWIGGGNYANGVLFNLNPSDASLYQFNKEKCAEIYAISVIKGKNILVTGHANGEIILWDLNTGVKKRSFGDYNAEVFTLAIAPDESRIYSGDGTGSVGIWDVSTGKKIKSTKENDNSIFTLHLNSKSNAVISGGSSGILYVLDYDLSAQGKIEFNKEAVLSCDSQDKTGRIICGLTNGYVATSGYNGSDKKIYKLHKDDVVCVEFIDQGRKVVTVSKSGVINLWDSALM